MELNLIAHQHDKNFLAKVLTTTEAMVQPTSGDVYWIRKDVDQYMQSQKVTDPDSQAMLRDLSLLLQPVQQSDRESDMRAVVERYRAIATDFWQTAVAGPQALASRAGGTNDLGPGVVSSHQPTDLGGGPG